jgi:hypothetical protein
LDRDAKFDDSATTFLQATGLTPKRTSMQALWQNGTAERWTLFTESTQAGEPGHDIAAEHLPTGTD